MQEISQMNFISYFFISFAESIFFHYKLILFEGPFMKKKMHTFTGLDELNLSTNIDDQQSRLIEIKWSQLEKLNQIQCVNESEKKNMKNVLVYCTIGFSWLFLLFLSCFVNNQSESHRMSTCVRLILQWHVSRCAAINGTVTILFILVYVCFFYSRPHSYHLKSI